MDDRSLLVVSRADNKCYERCWISSTISRNDANDTEVQPYLKNGLFFFHPTRRAGIFDSILLLVVSLCSRRSIEVALCEYKVD